MSSSLSTRTEDFPTVSPPITPKPAPSSLSFLPGFSPLSRVYNQWFQWRSSLGLPNPGTVENLQKEVKSTLTSNFLFDGARADIARVFSANPLFQTSHSFTLGSQTNTPQYTFTSIYATADVFLQGGLDHEGGLQLRANQAWNLSNITKCQAQLSRVPGQSMLQLEHEYQGLDYSASAKAINVNPVDLSGMYIGSYLQSLTKNFAIGVEAFTQRMPASPLPDKMLSYITKWTSTKRDWIATATMSPASLHATYWQKLGEKVEMAAELMVVNGPGRRDSIATLGARYNLRLSNFRAQLDTTGKVSAVLEQQIAPMLTLLVSGEIDHFKNASKFGIGISLDTPGLSQEELEAQGQLPRPPPA